MIGLSWIYRRFNYLGGSPHYSKKMIYQWRSNFPQRDFHEKVVFVKPDVAGFRHSHVVEQTVFYSSRNSTRIFIHPVHGCLNAFRYRRFALLPSALFMSRLARCFLRSVKSGAAIFVPASGSPRQSRFSQSPRFGSSWIASNFLNS